MGFTIKRGGIVMEQIVAFLTNGEMMNLNRIDDDIIVSGEFQAKGFITKIIIPEDIKRIGEKAFKDCDNLEEVIFPNGLEDIYPSAFENCKKLKKINLPNSVEMIGQDAFKCCEELSEVVLPAQIDIIAEGCFDGCRSLKEISLPKTVTTIGARAFRGTGLTEIYFPENLMKVGTSAFAGSNIAKVTGNTKNIVFVGYTAFESTPISLKRDENDVFRIDDIILFAGATPKEMMFENCLFASGCFSKNKTTKELLLVNCKGINPATFSESNVEVVQITGHWFTVSMNAFEKCKIRRLEIDTNTIVLSSYAFKEAEITDLFLWADDISFNLEFARDAHIKSFALKYNPNSITYDNETFMDGVFEEISFVGGAEIDMYTIPNNEEIVNILNSVYKKESA